MSGSASLRGQPLVALVAVLGGWIGGRAISWEPPRMEPPAAVALSEGAGGAEPASGGPEGRASRPASLPAPQSYPDAMGAGYGPAPYPGGGYPPPGYVPMAYAPPGYAIQGYGPAGYVPAGYAPPGYALPGYAVPGAYRGSGNRALAVPEGYALVRLADGVQVAGAPPQHSSFAERYGRGAGWFLPESARLAGASGEAARGEGQGSGGERNAAAERTGSVLSGGVAEVSQASLNAGAAPPRRWSADGWLFWRKGDGGQLAPGVLPSTYGASQAGAILRYRIDRTSRYRPTAYLRTTSTLGPLPETAAALGLAGRPVPGLPLTAAIEARLTEQGGTKRVQPVAMAVTELAPFKLPLGLRGEVYGQAGYVAGKFSTPFADGQLRVDRKLAGFGPVEARLGGGVWGGIQKGASRLDAGPGATLAFPLGRNRYGRLAFDWRQRVAGDAEPGSGPAVTLSAGF